MLKEENEYIFYFQFLEELGEELLENNLWELLHSESPSDIVIFLDNPNKLDVFDPKYILIGKGFNFKRIKDNIVYLIISINGFISYSTLVRDIILRFKNKICINNSDEKNGIYDDIIKYYCGKKKILLLEENKSFYLRISPLTFFSSKRNEYIKGNSDCIIKDISNGNIFIDDCFLYFYFNDTLNAVKKEKVNLI